MRNNDAKKDVLLSLRVTREFAERLTTALEKLGLHWVTVRRQLLEDLVRIAESGGTIAELGIVSNHYPSAGY